MSKTATFAATVTLASSAQGENAQIDFGPYSTPAANVSPGQLGIVALTNTSLASGGNKQVAGPYANTLPLPIYCAIMPVSVTNGATLNIGTTGDIGIQISSVNPSFIPVLTQTQGGDGGKLEALLYIGSNAATELNLGWI